MIFITAEVFTVDNTGRS